LNKVHARPLCAHGIKDVVDLKSKLVLPGRLSSIPKLFEWKVHLGAQGISACASHKDGLGGQPMITVLGFDIGEKEAKKSSGTLRRSKVVSDGGIELAQREGGHALTLFFGEGYTLNEELGVNGS
jgi:hypothetical protein